MWCRHIMSRKGIHFAKVSHKTSTWEVRFGHTENLLVWNISLPFTSCRWRILTTSYLYPWEIHALELCKFFVNKDTSYAPVVHIAWGNSLCIQTIYTLISSKFVLFLSFIFLFVCRFVFVCVYAWVHMHTHACACRCWGRPEDGVRDPGAGITECCEPLEWVLGRELRKSNNLSN